MLTRIRLTFLATLKRFLPSFYSSLKSLRVKWEKKELERKNIKLFKQEFEEFLRLSDRSPQSRGRFVIDSSRNWPIMNEKTTTTEFDRHYVFFIAWAVRKVKDINPSLHYDFSSSLHFCTTLSAFVPVAFYDYRPANIPLSNLRSGSADLTNLKEFKTNSLDSISCMHVIEHIGLGRYGDPIDPDGDIKSINELKRVLKKGGDLLFVVPMGQGEVRFNASRLYNYRQVLSLFDDFSLQEFTLIPDDESQGQVIENATQELADKQFYACGCFWFKKL